MKVSVQEIAFRDVNVLRYDADLPGLSFNPQLLHTGQNSGYQAVNLAVLLGAERIILLGYDMKYSATGAKHWHEDHEGPNPGNQQLGGWAKNFDTMLPDLEKAGVEVINATPGSAIECFERVKLESVL